MDHANFTLHFISVFLLFTCQKQLYFSNNFTNDWCENIMVLLICEFGGTIFLRYRISYRRWKFITQEVEKTGLVTQYCSMARHLGIIAGQSEQNTHRNTKLIWVWMFCMHWCRTISHRRINKNRTANWYIHDAQLKMMVQWTVLFSILYE